MNTAYHTDIASRRGIPPQKEGTAYTIPAVTMPNGEHIMDSRPIATALEALQPNPSLHLDDCHLEQVQASVNKFIGPMRSTVIPKIAETLNPRAAEYFYRTREQAFGKPLSEVAQSKTEDEMWKEAEPGIQELKSILEKDGSGPFVLGKQVSYADFVIVSTFVIVGKAEERLLETLLGKDETFSALYKACEKWLERDDH